MQFLASCLWIVLGTDFSYLPILYLAWCKCSLYYQHFDQEVWPLNFVGIILYEVDFSECILSRYFVQERQLKWDEYRDLASKLLHWLQDSTVMMLDRNFPTTLIEMKVYLLLFLQ